MCISKPYGAKIYLDTLDTGLFTPASIDSVAMGIHQVKLSKKYFDDYTESVTVIKDKFSGVNGRLSQSVLRSNYFPSYVGSYWNYTLFNNVTQSIDTIVYKVVDIVDVQHMGPFAVWVIEQKRKNVSEAFSDTNYITIINDTVKFYAQGYLKHPVKIIPFPLHRHKRWGGMVDVGPQGSVTDTDSLSIKTGNKYFCYKIVYYTGDPITNEIAFEEWFSSEVGYVRLIEWPFIESTSWNIDSYFIAYD